MSGLVNRYAQPSAAWHKPLPLVRSTWLMLRAEARSRWILRQCQTHAGWRWNGLILATERPGAKDQLLRGPLPNLSLCHLMEMRFYIWWTPPGTGELRCPRNHLVYSIAIQLGIHSLPKTFRGFTCSWFFP